MKTIKRFSLALATLGLLAPHSFAQKFAPPANGNGVTPVVWQPMGPAMAPVQGTPMGTVVNMDIQDVAPQPQVMGPVGPGPNPYGGMAPWTYNQSHLPDVQQAPCAEPKPESRFSVGIFGDYLYMKARGTDLIFSQPRDGSTTLSSPLGPQGILEPDYASGFRAGMDFRFGDCASIEATFTWWDDTTSAGQVAPANPTGAVIHPTLILPSIMNPAADGQAAGATMSLNLRTGDLDYKHVFCADPGHWDINWFAGARYSYLRQDMHADYAILGTTDVDTRITVEGIGPQVGLDGELFCCHGLRVFGRTSANLLASHIAATYNQANVFAGNQGNIDYRNDRIVPILELELGVGWVSPKGHVSVSAGYLVSAWFDTLTTPDFINAVQANNFSNSGGNLKSDMTFDGLTFRVEFRF
jgi:hypothetical protein